MVFRAVWRWTASSARARCLFPFQQPLSPPRPHPACLQSHRRPVKAPPCLSHLSRGGTIAADGSQVHTPQPTHTHPSLAQHTHGHTHTQRQPVSHASFDIHSSPSQMHHGVGDTLTRAYTHTHTTHCTSILNSELLLPIPLFLSLSLSVGDEGNLAATSLCL